MPIFIPLTVEPGTPILRGFDFLWSLIREAGRNGRHFTISELYNSGNDPHRRSAADYVKRLVAGGYVREAGWTEPPATGKGRRPPTQRLYRLVQRPLETPHLKRDGTEAVGRGRQQAMWNAMRALRTFTTADLAVAATTEERRITRAYAGAYCAALATAGYLLAPERGVWRLRPSAISGPKAPMRLRADIVYDPNRGAVAGAVEAGETGQ